MKDVALLTLVGVLILITLIANPGYFSHDEWQRFDYFVNHGFKSYVLDHWKIHAGSSFGSPVRPVAFMVQGIHSLFFQSYPFLVHLISAANTILVGIVIYALCMRYGMLRSSALLSAVLFISSPLTTLATGWSAALMDQLYVSFGLLTFHLADRYIFDYKRGLHILIFIAIGGMAGVLSKETGVIFPASLLLLLALKPKLLIPRWRKLLIAGAAWAIPIIFYLFFRLTAIEASFNAGPSDPYAASLTNIARNLFVYWLYPFHPLIGEVNGWQFQPLWSLSLAFTIHSLLVVAIALAYRWQVGLLYIFSYFLFLLPVILLPQQGAHYLFASAIPLSVAVACLATRSNIFIRCLATVLGIVLAYHGFRFQGEIYKYGYCMNRTAISLEANHASAGFPKDVYFSTDSNAPVHVLMRLIYGRNQVGERSQVNLHASEVNRPAPDGSLVLNFDSQCLLTVASKTTVVVENYGPKFTVEGVVPNTQPDGGMGIWIKLSDTKGLGNVQVFFAGEPAMATTVGDRLITAVISPLKLVDPGTYDITLNKNSTSEVFPVGVFKVKPTKTSLKDDRNEEE